MTPRWGVAVIDARPDRIRWILIATPLGGLAIERRALPTRDLAEPSVTVSLIGMYVEAREQTRDQETMNRAKPPGSMSIVRAGDRRWITTLMLPPIWGLVLYGPPRKEPDAHQR